MGSVLLFDTWGVYQLTYKAVHGIAPVYLQELVTKHAPSRRLRSGAQNLLKPPSTVPNMITYGDREFAQAAPKMWNALPYIIRQASNVDTFKSQLKTLLFQKFYGH